MTEISWRAVPRFDIGQELLLLSFRCESVVARTILIDLSIDRFLYNNRVEIFKKKFYEKSFFFPFLSFLSLTNTCCLSR